MPDRDLPPVARAIGRAICVLTYVLAFVVGIGDTVMPSTTIDGVVPDMLVAVTSAMTFVLSLIGLVAVLVHRWRWEWVAATVLTFVLLARSVPVWLSLPDAPTRMAAAAMMTIAALCGVGRRALDLWVFAAKTGAVARRARAVRG